MARKAFTLIELLVVISIIALLVGILLPALGAARESAKNMVCKSKLKQVAIGYELWLNDSDRRALSKQARGSRWPLALLERYPSEIASPGQSGNLEDSTLICPNDAEPTLTDSGQQPTRASYTVEVGGSYYMNNDINNYGPGEVDSGARTQPKWNLIWFNAGGVDGGNKAVELWAGDQIDAVKATSNYAMFWDSPGYRWQNNQPFKRGGELLAGVPQLWYFHGSHILENITPDPTRHRGSGNVLYFDSHVDSETPEEIDYNIIRWDNVNEKRL